MNIERLKEARRKSGLTQEHVAEMLHVSRQTISRWERGTSQPTSRQIRELAEIYQVPETQLMKTHENTCPQTDSDIVASSSEPGETTPPTDPEIVIESSSCDKRIPFLTDLENCPYRYEVLFYLILTIISCSAHPLLGLVVGLVSLAWARNRIVPKIFYIIVGTCLFINIWKELCFYYKQPVLTLSFPAALFAQAAVSINNPLLE